MFGIGFWECFMIGVVALVVFGPEKLPEIARSVGKMTGELKKGTDSMRKEFYNSVYTPAEEIKKKVTEEARNLITTENTEKKDDKPNGDAPS